MSSYVYIELDTKSPTIKIHAPSYTTTDLINNIILESDESLSDFQDIYVIDEYGVRHDYTFVKNGDNEFVGSVKFTGFPLGVATIYATLSDIVDNMSLVYSKNIEIVNSVTNITMSISDRCMEIKDEKISSRRIKDNSKVANVEIKGGFFK